MNVSAWSIRNPIPAVLLFCGLTLLGVMGFRAMKVQNFPDIDLPTIVVLAALPGAAPAQLEAEVARKIEGALATLQGVKHVSTRVQDGAVTITTEFRLEVPVQQALDEVRDAVARVRTDLPAALRDPVITRVNLAGMAVLAYTVSSPRMDTEALSWFVDNTLARQLLTVRGVGQVQRVGGATREVRVALDAAKLLALNASAADISRQLRAVQQDAAAGRAELGGAEQAVRTLATVATADALGRLDIPLQGGRSVRLDQVAQITDTVAEPRSAALLDGQPVVAFEVMRSLRAGEVEMAAGVRAKLAELQLAHPDLQIVEAFNLVEPVEANFGGSMLLMYEGAVLAVLVVWLFLRNWRATLVAATALPLSVLPAFAAMHYGFGFSLNIITLLSLSLVIGVLVDDAIVEIENIIRHLALGKSPRRAATEAADEIGLAVIATTFTLMAVFLPTAFMSGVAGKFFVQFGWTAAIAVFFSLLVARMLTPMLCAHLLRASSRPAKAAPPRQPGAAPVDQAASAQRPPRRLGLLSGQHYTRLVTWCLQHRSATVLVTAAFFISSLLLVPGLPTGFIPPDDLDVTQVSLTLPPGSTFAQTSAAAEQARLLVQQHPLVRHVYTAVGGGSIGSDAFAPGGVAEVRTASLTINLARRAERAGVSKQAVEGRLREVLAVVPGVRVQMGFGGSAERLVLVLAGDDGRLLADHARQVERELRGLPGIGAVTSSASLERPELVVLPDAARAADLGVTSAAIADTLRVATAGDDGPALAKLNLSQRQVPVVVRLAADARADISLLQRLPVPGAHGPVALGNVASLSLASGPAQIDRYDRRRNVNIEIELNQQPLGEVERQAFALPSLQALPAGVTVSTVGDAEAMAELFSSFGLALLTGVLCIYIVLVLLFKDFVQPGTILGALVLSVPGAVLALALTRTAISMPTLIGLIMLMGITTKNSILLIDYMILAQREHAMDRLQAVLDACHKRARPILMTTVAMAAGMLPIALGLGVDPSFRAPMAIVVIGGLITSTVLSLLVIPVLYTLVDDVVLWLRQPGRRARAAQAKHSRWRDSRQPDSRQPDSRALDDPA